ncbi:pitrilysin [Aliidiomarina minuta]|nr:pitrilysin [Aliidiomarina minuta]
MRHSLYHIILLSLTAVLFTACQPAPDEPAQSDAPPIYVSPNDDREYGVLELENGLQVIVVSDPEADKAAAAMNVHVGSLQNPDEQLGLAHYLEHMLFLGTEQYPDPDEYGDFMSRHGGQHNAYTADDHTNYMFEINNDRLDEALDRFADFFKAPKFYPEYSEKEINAVDSEWSMRRASDGFILFALNNKKMNPEHPIARFRIGNSESLGDKEGSVLHEEMLAFYEKYYSANLMTASVVGNYSVEQLKEKARAAFADIPNHNAEVAEIEVPAVTGSERKIQLFYKPQMEMRLLLLDFTIENNLHEFRKKPNEYIAYLINSEMPGTPAAYFREQEWVDSINASAQENAYGNAGRFRIQLELTGQGMEHREAMVGVLFEYIEKIREEGVRTSYYEEIKQVLDNRFQFLERSGAFDYATSLAASMQHYPLAHVIDAAYRFDEFNEEAIHRVLDQLTVDNLRVWFVSPEEEVDQELHYFDGEYRIEPLQDSVIANWLEQGREVDVSLPSVNTLLPEDLAIRPIAGAESPQKAVQKEGVTAWYQRSERFHEPRAEVTLNFNQAHHERDLRQRLAASVLVEAFRLSQQALAKEASIAGVDFNLSVGNGLTLGMSGFNDKQPELAQRVLADFASYEPSASRVEQVKDRLRRSIENQNRQFPVQQLGPRFGHLFSVPSAEDSERLQTLRELDVADLIQVRDALLADNYLRALVVGNYSAEDVEELVAAVQQIVATDASARYQRSPVLTPRAGQKLQWQRNLELDDSAILDAFIVEDTSVQSRAKTNLMAELMHNRFFNQLRTEKQLGYAVGVTALGAREHGAMAFYIQSPVASTAELLEHFDDFRADYLAYLEEMDDEAFVEAREGLLVSLREQPQNLREEAARIRADWQRENYSFDTRLRLQQAIERLSKADMVQFYQSEIQQQQNVMRVLIQLQGTRFSDADWAELEDAQVIEDIGNFQRQWLQQE